MYLNLSRLDGITPIINSLTINNMKKSIKYNID